MSVHNNVYFINTVEGLSEVNHMHIAIVLKKDLKVIKMCTIP